MRLYITVRRTVTILDSPFNIYSDIRSYLGTFCILNFDSVDENGSTRRNIWHKASINSSISWCRSSILVLKILARYVTTVSAVSLSEWAHSPFGLWIGAKGVCGFLNFLVVCHKRLSSAERLVIYCSKILFWASLSTVLSFLLNLS